MKRRLAAAACAALLAACASPAMPGARGSGMGIDAFGHTQMSDERTLVTAEQLAHLRRLIASLRVTLPKYRSVTAAIADGYRPDGPDVPVGTLKHFVNYANLRANYRHLDPEKPMALLYRRTKTGFDLAGVMFSAPIAASMDELDKRIPLAYGHWHAHRNVCQPRHGVALSREEARRFGFSGSINTREACAAAGGVFFDNVFGWMVHVYPFETLIAKQF